MADIFTNIQKPRIRPVDSHQPAPAGSKNSLRPSEKQVVQIKPKSQSVASAHERKVDEGNESEDEAPRGRTKRRKNRLTQIRNCSEHTRTYLQRALERMNLFLVVENGFPTKAEADSFAMHSFHWALKNYPLAYKKGKSLLHHYCLLTLYLASRTVWTEDIGTMVRV
jgi:hypothetical protein